MRYFIALEIPQKNRQELKTIQIELKQLLPNIRLTDNDKLHLTIAFIGEQPQDLKGRLIEVINNASIGIDPFEVTPSYLDGFPKLHQPHTLWLGVKGDVDKLFLLEERIRDGLADLKLGVDQRRYVPHIAVGKFLSQIKIGEELEQRLEELVINRLISPITISSIKLLESIPDQGFHQHNTLAEIKL